MSIRQISIQPALNGYMVHVGSQTVVFTSAEEMCSELLRYYKDPISVEKEYVTLSSNSKHLLLNEVEPEAPRPVPFSRGPLSAMRDACETTGPAVLDQKHHYLVQFLNKLSTTTTNNH